MPFYLTSIAKGGLINRSAPEEPNSLPAVLAGLVSKGEETFVRAANQANLPYIVPTVASSTHQAIFAAAAPGQCIPYQFYLLGDNADSIEKLKQAVHFGCSAVVITVDQNSPRKGELLSATQATSGVFPDPRCLKAQTA